jgi:serine/threonine protein kinase
VNHTSPIKDKTMLNSPKVIYQSNKTSIFFEEKKDFETAIVIKTLNSEYPEAQELTQFSNEYEILKGIDLEGVRKVYKKEQRDKKNALILEYVEGKNLQVFFKNNLKTAIFLPIAIQIAHTLGQIHQKNIVHKDFHSNNILVNTLGKIKVIDFDISAKVDYKTQALASSDRLEGTLDYISPEQTGRMNRLIDGRSDLYSLGVSFYEVLAGQLPFQSKDPMEIVHSHIAKKPIPVEQVNVNIPTVLSDIVQKLLAKNAEDRYQSAFGLEKDLKECLKKWT